jgi:hypothetical protein
MPGNKYFQKGGHYYNDEVFRNKFDELLETLDREQADGVYSIPNFDANQEIYKENGLQTGDVDKVEGKGKGEADEVKKNKIRILSPDQPIYNNNENPLKAGNWKFLGDDNKTLSKPGENGMIDIMKYYKDRQNVYNLYVPMRSTLYPDSYAKLVRPVPFKYDSGEAEVHETSGQAEPTELEKTIKELIYLFGEPVTVDGGQHNWENTMIGRLCAFIEINGEKDKVKEDKHVSTEFDRIFKGNSTKFDDEYYTDEEEQPATFFKLLAIFAWGESGMLMKQMETNKGGEMYGGGIGDPNEEYPPLVTDGDLEKTKIRNKRIMWFLVILSYVYHLFLFITCGLRMYAFITRVLDIRQQYITDGDADLEDRGGFFASFNVFTDIMSIGMVEIVSKLATNSYAVATKIAERVVAQGRDLNAASMNRGIAGWINDVITGVAGKATVSSAALALEHEIDIALYSVKLMMLDLYTEAASVSGGVMNAINGLTTTSAVMISLINPTAVTEVHAQASLAAYASVITAPTSVYGFAIAAGNVVALGKLLINVYRRVPPMRTFAQEPVGLLTEEGEEGEKGEEDEDEDEDEVARPPSPPPKGEGEGVPPEEGEHGGGGTRHRRKKRGSRNKRKSTKTKKRTYRKR